jgi:hypothetical protein
VKPEEMEAEIKTLRQQQEHQKWNWVRWGLVSFGIAGGVLVYAGIREFMFNRDTDMSFFALFIFLTMVFLNAGSAIPFPFSRRPK